MEVYLVRHTETVCKKGICYGQSDVMILEPYNILFESILKQLPQDAVLYSSPLKRCSILANYIQSHSQIDTVIEDARIMEMNFGDWELKEWKEIPKEILDPWMNDFVTTAVPNGESFINVNTRVWDFMTTQIEKKYQQPLIVVTHSGVIRSILCKINNIPLQDAFKEQLDYGVVVKLVL